MDQTRMVTHAQVALLEQCRKLSREFGTPDVVPMRAAIVLCSYHFRSPPINVLRELKRAGYVDFDGEGGDLRVYRLPLPREVLASSPRPMSLPRGDESLRLLRAEFAKFPFSTMLITKAALGRANAETDALTDDEIVPRRKKPAAAAGSSRR